MTQILDRQTIVIVDDDEHVLRALAFALGAQGFGVRAFGNARQVLGALDIAAASCLIVDQNLPDFPGVELLAVLRADGVDVPAVVITTNPSHTLRARTRAMGVEIVEKPLLTDDLFRQVRALSAIVSERPLRPH